MLIGHRFSRRFHCDLDKSLEPEKVGKGGRVFYKTKIKEFQMKTVA